MRPPVVAVLMFIGSVAAAGCTGPVEERRPVQSALTASQDPAESSPYGRLFPVGGHRYDPRALALLAEAVRGNREAPKPAIPAGYTFFGQFLDHDLTEFRAVDQANLLAPVPPVLGEWQRVVTDGGATAANGRTAIPDLDNLYHAYGIVRGRLFDESGLFRLAGGGSDILRPPGRPARVIADPRDDENKVVVQVHLLFEKLHNRLQRAAVAARPGTVPASLQDGGPVFEETRAAVQKVYRRIILNDYLPRMVRQQEMDAVLETLAAGTSLYQQMNRKIEEAYRQAGVQSQPAGSRAPLALPVEFAEGVFRLGHSQVRGGYRLKAGGPEVPLFGSARSLEGDEPLIPDDQDDYLVHWGLFFELGDPPSQPQQGAPIDASITPILSRLPDHLLEQTLAVRTRAGMQSNDLPERNLQRGMDFALPSGQEAVALLRPLYGPLPVLTPAELFPPAEAGGLFAEALAADPDLGTHTPLWYYILREAEHYEAGPQLGPVGGLIFAETVLGLLASLPPEEFYLFAERRASGAAAGGSADDIRSMPELIKFLGAAS